MRELYFFESSFFRILPHAWSIDYSVKQKVMLCFRAVMGGYRLFYFNDDTESRIVAYLFLKHNYFGKYAFMDKRDCIINPVFTTPTERNKGYGKRLIAEAICNCPKDCKRIYAVIVDTNYSSQSAVKKNDFQFVGYSKKGKWSHKLTDDRTSLLVFCKEIRGDR